MWVAQLRLVNFRNYRSLRLEPHPGILIFSGHNGQGKTNLLEAVYVLATTRSPRTSAERELLSWRTPEDADLAAVVPPFARLDARVRRAAGEIHLELTFEATNTPSGSRHTPLGAIARDIKVNGLPTRASGLVGQLPVVYFSPADVELAGGAPAGRRQYLNLANSQASAPHMRALQRYNRVLMQRNQVLRLVRERRQPPTALDPWTEQMVSWGAQVLEQRLRMLHEINVRIGAIFRDLFGGDETLHVEYRSTVCGSVASLAELEAAFRARQAEVGSREIDQAVSLVGPHRDDFAFTLDEVDLNTYGSRGQQRLAVLALKLAEADWMRASTGEIPVVLLDDMLSELDPRRRGYVLHRVAEPDASQQRQVWITTTDPEAEPVADAEHYVIEAGQVRAL